MSDGREVIDELTKRLVDEGKLIEAGWVVMRMMALPKDAPQIQIDGMREAFFAGAQHLFSSIVTMLDPEAEPTERDLRRMTLINSELEAFIAAYKMRHMT